MADVLLVYVHEDRVFGEGLATSLEGSGLTVARCENEFDYKDPAPCVLILWSAVSTRSGTLRDIATQAHREGRLITARVDASEAPQGLGRPGAFDLSRWSGDPDDQGVDPVFFAVDRLVSARLRRAGAAPIPAPPPPAPGGQQAARQMPQPRDIATSMRADMAIPPTYTPIGRKPPPAPEAPVRAGPLGGRAPSPPVSSAAPGLAEEALAWRRIEHSTDPSDYLNFLTDFGAEGTFSELAQFKLDKLTGSKVKAGGFMQHNPSPHLDTPKKARLPEPRDAPREVAPPREPPRETMRESAPWRETGRDMPPPRERERDTMPAIARQREPEPEEYREPSRGRQRSASGRPRRRVPVDQAVEDARPIRAERQSGGGGGVLRVLVLVALLAGGGYAFMKLSAKPTNEAAAPSEQQVAEAQRAAPLPEDSAPSRDPSSSLETTYVGKPAVATPASATRTATNTRNTAAPRAAAPAPAPRQDNTAAPMPPISFRAPSGEAPPAPAFTPPAPQPEPTPAPQPAAAQPATPADDGYRALIWLQRPTGGDLEALFPSAAATRGVGGQATLDCEVLPTGRLTCTVASESPTGMGFGKAAMQASKKFQAAAKAVDGRDTIGKHTRLPIRFQAAPPER